MAKSVSKRSAENFPIVGVGASAGGLDALIKLFKNFQHDVDAAFVLIQHLDPTLRSQTVNILSRNTTLPVEQIHDGIKVLKNRIYVIPPESAVTLKGNTLVLSPKKNKHDSSVIDKFFNSLAAQRKQTAIGVILSGTGTDGTAGLKAIRKAKGTTFAQDPVTAKYDGMPTSAITSNVVDFVLSPEKIALEVTAVVKAKLEGASKRDVAPEGSPKSRDLLEELFSLLQAHAQIDFSAYKPSTVSRRIQRQMRLHKIPTLEKYIRYLKKKPDALNQLADDMFIHVTEFFRNPDSFEQLKRTVFPQLLKNRIEGVPIRIWIPGCSSGEETYSIAISLLEYLHSKGLSNPVQVFGTDISDDVIKIARAAVYREAAVKGLSKKRLTEYFDKTVDGYKVKKSVRDLCIFSRHDVTSSPPFAKIDLLSCRNLLIYFSHSLQMKVIPVFHYALNPDGFLWLGKSEAPTGFSKFFILQDKSHKIYSKVNIPSPINFKFASGKQLTESALSVKKASVSGFEPVTGDSQKEFDRIILSRYAPAGVMVNRDMEIIQVRGHTSAYLELPTGMPNNNLLKMIRKDLAHGVRMALQKSIKLNEPARQEDLAYFIEHERKSVTVEVIPVNPYVSQRERHYLVLFEEDASEKSKIKAKKQVKIKSSAKKRKSLDGESYVKQLLDEIDAARDYQQFLSEGYETTQAELTAANEELQSANEELQSANEEMETGKEELQAANEELTTVNEELQDRNTELITLNEKLAWSEERFRLLVTGVKDYAIFLLDPQGHVASWNEGARSLKGYEESEIIGKHFSVFYPEEKLKIKFPEQELKIAKEKGRFEDEGWRIKKDGSRFWANVVITRINNKHGHLIGFSKITRDLTERKQAEERFKLLVDGVKDYAIYSLDPAGKILTWNEGAHRIKGYSSEQVIGQNFSVFYTDKDIKEGKPASDLKKAAETGRYEDSGWRVRKDGSHFWANTVITRITDANGNLMGFSKITRDLTEQMKFEEELRKNKQELEVRVQQRTEELSAAINARDEFLSIASHELKTPLTSLKLQIQMSKRSFNPNNNKLPSIEELTEFYDMTIRQINSLANLVEDLLDTSRIQTGHFLLHREEINLFSLVSDVAKRFAHQIQAAGGEITLNLSHEINGQWDRHRLEQVIVNLISNAIKYAPKSNIAITTVKKETTAVIEVRDFGPGIAKDMQAKIFERFERAKASRNVGGMGLGLFISRKIIEAHGGKIYVESEQGLGSKFIIELPLIPEEQSK